MELESVKKMLENEENSSILDSFPLKFMETLVMHGLRVHVIQPGRLLCSFTVPPRLLNSGNSLHSGATATIVDVMGTAVIHTVGYSYTGVSVDINVSYTDAAYAGEEIEIEAKALHVGKAIAVVSVELRKKKTGKIIAQGRHSKYIAVRSKV